jgi:hypothetical protein
MTNMIIEAVIVAFCMGGAMGAIITMHLQHKNAHNSSKVESEEFDGHELKRAEVRVHPRRFK